MIQQHTATARLTAQQQALETQVSALVTAAAKKKKKRTPMYLQLAVPARGAVEAATISSLLGAAPRSPTLAQQARGQGVAGQGGPPGPPPQQPGRTLSSPSSPPLPPSSGGYTPPTQSPANPLQLPACNYQFTYWELTDIVTATVATTLVSLQTGQAKVSKLKLKDPKEFDGKPATQFTAWWESVSEYIEFYPRSADASRISWLSTLLTGMV